MSVTATAHTAHHRTAPAHYQPHPPFSPLSFRTSQGDGSRSHSLLVHGSVRVCAPRTWVTRNAMWIVASWPLVRSTCVVPRLSGRAVPLMCHDGAHSKWHRLRTPTARPTSWLAISRHAESRLQSCESCRWAIPSDAPDVIRRPETEPPRHEFCAQGYHRAKLQPPMALAPRWSVYALRGD